MIFNKWLLTLPLTLIYAHSLDVSECRNQGPNMSLAHSYNFIQQNECDKPTTSDVQFLLYTREKKCNPTILNTTNPFLHINLKKPIIMATHGWVSSAHGYGMQPLKNAYLKQYDCNMILLNWAEIAQEDLSISTCKIPGIAKIAAQLLCSLENRSSGIISGSHIIGHSLGGHLVGYVGKFTKSICNKTVSRITGLDPAGLGYEKNSPAERLNKTDAEFVDVLHTNGGELGLGYLDEIGDVDFYINCGRMQPGCHRTDIKSEIESILRSRDCSHFRVLDLMIESINSTRFVGESCKTCPHECKFDKFNATRVVMGEHCPRDAPHGTYYVRTKNCPPYAL